MFTATALGNIGRDAELITFEGGSGKCSFTMAVDSGKKDADGKRITEWVKVEIFGKRGESLAPHLLKGVKVVVSGRFELQRYQDKNGASKVQPTINANDIAFAGGAAQQQQAAPPPPPKPAPVQVPSTDDIFGSEEISF